MNKLSHILVVIDSGSLRQPALDRALALYQIAKNLNQQCKITAVVPVKKDTFSLTSFLAVDAQTIEKSVITKHERWLRAFLQVNAMDISVDTKVIYSKDPALDISLLAQDIDASVIIKSNEIHGFLDTILSRSMDIEVLRKSSVPVLIAKNNIFKTDRPVAVALDLSKSEDEMLSRMNLKLLRYAQLLSKLTGAQIKLVNAITPVMPPVVVDIPSYTPDHVYGPSLKERIEYALEFASRHHIDEKNCIICEGNITDVIYDACKSIRPSVLIIGSQARAGLSSMLIGNISEKLADLIECDVAVITANSEIKE